MSFAAQIRGVCFAATVALLLSIQLSAQRYTFRQYGTAEGLSDLSVNCLLQDRAGFIWVGTDNGLFRYDGTRFHYFGDAEGLPSAQIQDLAESPTGVLWVATQGGLARWSGRRFNAVDIGLTGQLQAISFDSHGRMYLEHVSGIVVGEPAGAGSYRFRTVVPGSLSGLFVKGEEVWFGKGGDLWRLAGDSVKCIGSPSGLPIDHWDAVAQDASGNLWARSATRLYELPKGRARFLNRSSGIPHTSNSRLYPDRHGGLFVSSDSGVVLVSGGEVTPLYIDARHGMPTDVTGPILMDREESLWVGTSGGGLLRPFGHGEWLSWKKEDGLLDNNVWSILHDCAGQLWVGTSGGLAIYGPNGRLAHSWTSRNGLAGDMALGIAEGAAGDIYVATYPSGISQFRRDGTLLRTYGTASGLTTPRIEQIKFDLQGQLWAVGLGGCFRSLTCCTPATSPNSSIWRFPAFPCRRCSATRWQTSEE